MGILQMKYAASMAAVVAFGLHSLTYAASVELDVGYALTKVDPIDSIGFQDASVGLIEDKFLDTSIDPLTEFNTSIEDLGTVPGGDAFASAAFNPLTGEMKLNANVKAAQTLDSPKDTAFSTSRVWVEETFTAQVAGPEGTTASLEAIFEFDGAFAVTTFGVMNATLEVRGVSSQLNPTFTNDPEVDSFRRDSYSAISNDAGEAFSGAEIVGGNGNIDSELIIPTVVTDGTEFTVVWELIITNGGDFDLPYVNESTEPGSINFLNTGLIKLVPTSGNLSLTASDPQFLIPEPGSFILTAMSVLILRRR